MIIAIIIIAKKQGRAISGFKADAAKNGVWQALAYAEQAICSADEFVGDQTCLALKIFLALTVMSIFSTRSSMRGTPYPKGIYSVHKYLINVLNQ